MKSKVEIHENHVIKYNTNKFSSGIEKIIDLGISHKRELRIYNAYNPTLHKYIKIPKLYEANNTYIKIERLYESKSPNSKKLEELIPFIREFLLLGESVKKMRLSDFISSPAISVIRGSIYGFTNFGLVTMIKTYKSLFSLALAKDKHKNNFLIHKDLKWNQNMMNTNRGLYFYDFGTTIITKKFFLLDVVGLSLDVGNKNFDINPSINLLKTLGFDHTYKRLARSQIRVLIMRVFLHLHPNTKKNKEYMSNVKEIIKNLDLYLEGLNFE